MGDSPAGPWRSPGGHWNQGHPPDGWRQASDGRWYPPTPAPIGRNGDSSPPDDDAPRRGGLAGIADTYRQWPRWAKVAAPLTAAMLVIAAIDALVSEPDEESTTTATTEETTTTARPTTTTTTEPTTTTDATTSTTTTTTPPTTAPRTTSAPDDSDDDTGSWTEDDIEYLLAAIELDGRPQADDVPLIEAFSRDLDAAEQACTQDRRMLSDMAVRAGEILDEEGRPQSLVDLVAAYAEAVPPEQAPMDCAEVMATVMVLAGD
jgi:hypothetical protein